MYPPLCLSPQTLRPPTPLSLWQVIATMSMSQDMHTSRLKELEKERDAALEDLKVFCVCVLVLVRQCVYVDMHICDAALEDLTVLGCVLVCMRMSVYLLYR